MAATTGATSRNRRIVAVAVAVLLASTGVAGAVHHRTLARLARAVTLFQPDVIQDNFRTLGQRFDARVVHRPPTASPLRHEPRPLPATYPFQGRERDLAAFLDRTGTTGLVVARDDVIVHEDYRCGNDAASQVIAWSVTKSFVSALVGIALHEGLLPGLDVPVSDGLPALAGTGYDGVSLRHVLQMSSGVRFDEEYGDFWSDINRLGRAFAMNRPLEDFVTSLDRERPPGTFHHYVSMDTQVLGMAVAAATGGTLSAYLQQKIWQPLGMESDALWLVDGAGMEAAFGGLNAVLRDWVRFGLLHLREGDWNGVQVLPAAWVREATRPTAPYLVPGPDLRSTWVLGYGYQWWVPRAPEGDYLAIGVYGQFLYVHPGHRIVIARSSAYADYDRDGDDMELETIEAFRAIARALGAPLPGGAPPESAP